MWVEVGVRLGVGVVVGFGNGVGVKEESVSESVL